MSLIRFFRVFPGMLLVVAPCSQEKKKCLLSRVVARGWYRWAVRSGLGLPVSNEVAVLRRFTVVLGVQIYLGSE